MITITKSELARIVAEALHCNQSYDEYDYIYHLDKVVEVLQRFGFGSDDDLLAAGFLHDSVEDQGLKIKIIEKTFGPKVSELVYCVTNELGANRRERNEKTYPKIRKNSLAVALKLADRIANVEHALKKQNFGIHKMYQKEYPTFKYVLQTEGEHIEMWEHLDYLLIKQ